MIIAIITIMIINSVISRILITSIIIIIIPGSNSSVDNIIIITWLSLSTLKLYDCW